MISFTGDQEIDALLDSIIEGTKTIMGNELTEEQKGWILDDLKKCDTEVWGTLDLIEDPVPDLVEEKREEISDIKQQFRDMGIELKDE